MTRAALAFLGLVACSSGRTPSHVDHPPAGAADAAVAAVPDGPPPLDRDMPKLAERTAQMMEALGGALGGDGDCAALATAATKALADFADVRAATGAVAARGDGRALDAALEAVGDRIVAASAQMSPALDRCKRDAGFAAALAPLDKP